MATSVESKRAAAALAARERRAKKKAMDAVADIQRAPTAEIKVGDTVFVSAGLAAAQVPEALDLACTVSGAQLPESPTNKLFRLLAIDECMDQEKFLRVLLVSYIRGFPRRVKRAVECGVIK